MTKPGWWCHRCSIVCLESVRREIKCGVRREEALETPIPHPARATDRGSQVPQPEVHVVRHRGFDVRVPRDYSGRIWNTTFPCLVQVSVELNSESEASARL